MRTKILLALGASALLMSGCSMAPKMEIPKTQLPSAQKEISINVAWWEQFNDNNLNALIAEALKNNDDLKLAVANVEKARAEYGFSKADMYPQINLGGDATRQRKSVNSYPGSYGGTYNNYGLSASVAYELDFWGKVFNQKNAALSSLLATDANKEAFRISLITDVATYYFNLVAINEQLKIANDSLKSYEETYEYRKMQLKHGVVDELVVAQAKAQAASAKTQIQVIKSSEVKTKSALTLLLGRTPKEIFEKVVTTSQALPESITIPAGLPASLLQNRPDVKAAEETLRAKTALIGVAKAAYFPSISLTGNLGYQSQKLSNLVSGGSEAWGFGPTFNFPLLDFGRISNTVKASRADQKAAMISYDKAVKTAYKEVYESLESIKISKSKRSSVLEEMNAYNNAYMIAKKKFERGTTSYLDVLSAQTALLNARLTYVSAKSQLLTDEATLYKTLGGGWSQKTN
jgi:multidrug efflux system outer membrane protein